MHRSILNFFRASPVTRPLFFLLGDVFLLALSCQLAFLLRYDWDFTNPWSEEYLLYTPIFIAIKIPVFLFFRFYSMSWRYVGAFELVDVAKGIILSSAIVAIVVYIVNPGGIFTGFPRSAVLLDCVLSLLLVGCFRLARRLQRHIHERPLEEGRRTLIVGAGNAGEMIVRDVRRHQESKYRVVAFVDDDETKRGSFLQGIKVMGTTEMIPRLASELNIETILIAVPSATTKEMKRIMSHIRKSLVNDVRVLPGIGKILEGSIALSDIKDVSIEDIVGREQATINHKEIFSLIRGKVVLITGAGGSIGSEIVRQVLKNEPKAVYALDSDETELFNLDNEIKSLFQGVLLTPVVADVCDANKISHVFAHCAPDIVLHAAAYKHVPLMEEYPEEAVRVNVLGTMNLLEESCKRGVEKFVMISTDKAVTPTSVMGTTKRVAEELVKWYNTKNSTKFISVRFGNVVGSRGSVIPIFKNQISRGGPVTVTHRDM
ncbi:MAG TPA: SDR family NAD(P)-dependent oxidoreductase, partial [Syntrophorhabdaceae bacterium]